MAEKTNSRQEKYNGNQFSVQLSGYKAKAQKIPYGTNTDGVYFDGYPQIIKGEETLPVYKVKSEKDIKVPMRDGIHLYTDVYRPDVEGKSFPALLAFAHWSKNTNEAVEWMAEYPQAYLDTPFWDGTLEACDFNYLVPRGFAHIIPDPRGVGDSEGYGTKPWCNYEDLYDLIEWIAAQPWCNGNVGMIGPSAYSIMQIHAGVAKPPHLVALRCDECACGTWDYFSGCFDIMEPYMIETGGHANDSPPATPNYEFTPMPPSKLGAPNIEELIAEAREFPDYKYNTKWYSFIRYPRKFPQMFDMLLENLHPTERDFSQTFTNDENVRDITIPVYLGTPFNQRLYEFKTLDTWNTVSTPPNQKKLILYPPNNTVRPYVEYHDEMARWHEYWLAGKDNGIMDEPPVKYFVIGINKWRFDTEWPPKRASSTPFYLLPGGLLAPEFYPQGKTDTDVLYQQAPYIDPQVYCLRYSSEILERDFEIVGEVALNLFATIDTNDTTWYADLVDTDENGEQLVVSSGALRAKYRQLVKEKSTPTHPVHPRTEPIYIVPGSENEYNIHMLSTACIFRKGHRIEVIIRNQDDLRSRLSMNGVYHMPFMQSVRHEIKLGKSHILLPVVKS